MPAPSSDSRNFPERFSRCVDLYGVAGFQRIRESRIAVIGLGGVGSHAALALARSGIGELLLVDFDPVTSSSLNRSPVAGPDDVGKPKATVLGDALSSTCPDTAIVTSTAFFHDDSADDLLEPPPTLVVDAIDSLNPKVALLLQCRQRQIDVVSSMGAAGRIDSSALRCGDIAATRVCPLAKMVRRRLKRRGVDSGITCVYSVEKPAPPLPPDLDDLSLDRGRVRNRLPSQISLPGSFGYALAGLALSRLSTCHD